MTRFRTIVSVVSMLSVACASGGSRGGIAEPLGIFTGYGDIGIPSTMGSGSASYSAATGRYTITGGGENMWAAADHFQYVWVKVSGDIALETISLRSKDRRVVYVVTQPQRIEAPNWFPDRTNTLYFNTRGRLFRVQADLPGQPPTPGRQQTPQAVDLGILTNINNDHGLSFDGKTWAFSDQSQLLDGRRPSLVYTMPVAGGAPTLVTTQGPSYFHGWSPDGRTLTYCGQRGGNFDIYTVPATGGAEVRLTTNAGKDDGPEYSPDGRFIYFNSDRSGTMQIWRMAPDGSNQEQVTDDEWDNWFPHVSPNGRQLAFLSYERGVGDHPENKNVRLRTMTLDTRAVEELAKLFGGQGTINVPSWSPDSQYLAFVSYQVVPRAP